MLLAHDLSKGDRTKDVKINQNITFETMLLAPDTLKGLKESGFHQPSPIQLYGIPIGKCGFDLLLEAKSGTGKTAVFSIVALEKLEFTKGLQVVILTPTREIAAQICDVLKQIGSRYKELQVEVVMGGLPLQDDIEKFKKPVHIVVGSPGRLRHLIQDKYIDVKSVRLLVLDEADKLMESSFQSDIKYIHTSLPQQKQVIMSSATYPQSTRDLINNYVQNASHVCPDSDCVLLGIEQKVSVVKYNSNIIRHTQDRFKELHKILGRLQFKQCLVFCNYQVRVAEVHKLLNKEGWPSQKLYGQQEQVDRLDALKTLQQYKCRILVSTDLAARGIDASNIDLVINFEPPYDWQTYLHRIGRAGRFGSHGLAVTILSEGKEEQKFKEMIDSMELSVNICRLWSDTEFNIRTSSTEPCNSSSDKSATTDLIEKVSSRHMWELLSCESNAVNSMEAFESHSMLRENMEIPKIEPFSELICSLQDKTHLDSDENVVFKHIEIGKTSSVLKSFETEKDTVIEDFKETENNNENKKELQSIAPDSSKHINDNIATTTISVNNIGKQVDTNNLLNLELPTSFSSSKHKNHKTERKMYKTQFENKPCNSNFTIKSDLRVDDIVSKWPNHSEIFPINGDTDNLNLHLERDVHHRNENKNKFGERNNYYENKHRYKNTQQTSTRSHMSRLTLENHWEQNVSAKLYSNWYSQLKMRIKHIEQAIYISEMSKF